MAEVPPGTLRIRLTAAATVLHPLALLALPVLAIMTTLRRAKTGGALPFVGAVLRSGANGLALFGIGAIAWWIPTYFHGGVGTWRDLVQIAFLLAIWLVLDRERFSDEPLVGPSSRADISLGITVGLALLATLSSLEALFATNRAALWFGHSNTLGAHVATVTIAAVVLKGPNPGHSITAMVFGLVAIISSGSRGALLALVLGLGWLIARAPHRRFLLIAGLVTATMVASLIHPRIGPTIRTIVAAGGYRSIELTTANVLGEPPQALGVEVAASIDDQMVTTITKAEEGEGARLQFQLVLFPDVEYTVHSRLRSYDDVASAGILGVGFDEDGRRSTVRYSRTHAGWLPSASGSVMIQPLWQRVSGSGVVEFDAVIRNIGTLPIRLWIGPGPYLAQGGVGTRLDVLAFAVTGPVRQPFVVTRDTPLAVIQALDRWDSFRVAWRGWLDRPWLGRGGDAFASYARWHPASQRTSVATHAHNLLLQTLFERGALGAAGLVVMLLALIVRSPAAIAPLALTIIAVNMFDVTFWASQAAAIVVATGSVVAGDSGGAVRADVRNQSR